MKLTFKNYRLAYTQTEEIYKLIQNDGILMLYDMEVLCDSLKEKWHGEDAPAHINKLLGIQKALKNLFENSISMICEVSDRVVSIHSAINKISGHIDVPVNLKNVYDVNKVKEDAEKTKSYQLVSLMDEYLLLDTIIGNFMTFKDTFAQKFDEFFDNWKDDPKKKRIQDTFEDAMEHVDEYQLTFEETRTALGNAAANTEQVLEG